MIQWINGSLKTLAIALITVLLLEFCFRLYIVDFYAAELKALNNSFLPKSDKQKTVLVFGDSFSANSASYVSKLQARLPYHFVNSAVSGTGIMEASFMASSRLKRFNPDLVVYQIYLGNDLLDIRHRPSGKTSLIRRIYHSISDRIRVFKFLNYRLGQIRASVYQDLQTVSVDTGTKFSADYYSPRQKMIFSEEPLYLENTLQLKNGRIQEFEVIINRLHEIENQLKPKTEFIVVVVPHCSQVNQTYNERMRVVGSKSKNLSSNLFVHKLREEFSNLTVVDVLPSFQSIDSTNYRLYLENDPHLSEIGQTALANVLEPYLQKSLN